MTCRFEEVIQELELFLEDAIPTKTGKAKNNYSRKLQLLKKAELARKKLVSTAVLQGVASVTTKTNVKKANVSNASDYTAYAKELIGTIKAKNIVTPSKDLSMAMNILKGIKDAPYATSYSDGRITYPDFSGVVKDGGSIQNIVKATGKSAEAVRNEAEKEANSFYMSMTKVHEHIHIGSVRFMEENPDAPETRYVEKLYTKVQEFAKENPEHKVNQIQGKYWDKNVKEFVAVSLSNPEMVKFLGSVGLSMDESVTPKNSILKLLVGKLLDMLGVKDNTMLVEGLMTSLMNMNDTGVKTSNSGKGDAMNSPNSKVSVGSNQKAATMSAIINNAIGCK